MTRSQKAPSRREQFNKSVRAKAQSEGTTFRDAATKKKAALKEKPEGAPSTETERRNPGRSDGDRWKGSQFITGKQIGDQHSEFYDSEDDQNELYDNTSDLKGGSAPMVNILDLAKPAKRRGVAKHFELIPKTKRVLSLASTHEGDDFDLVSNESTSWLDDDTWEDLDNLYDHDAREEAMVTYSDVLRGG
ncbi:hypothetical protein CPB83DRAFT_849669 [Crepidotus variabilis]|uniref:Uncharacterized protein n=1 Tax=Crepidotus variabilis TaxID=179855 RepID=A0A9P6ELT5_9AGAR|nr:hypothetical protein CPB83DRAFT_849669 [Crepidotus variabilis]